MTQRRGRKSNHRPCYDDGCFGKTRFREGKEAKLAASKINVVRTQPEALRAYECPFCHGWHLTKKEQ